MMPSLLNAGVCGLSTMTCERFANPFSSVGSIVTRRRGASTSVPVIGRTVTEPSSSKRSAWTTRAGRGLPWSPCSATVTRSPRLTPPSRSCQRSQTTLHRLVERLCPHCRERSGPAEHIPRQSWVNGCREPRSDRPQACRPELVPPPPNSLRTCSRHHHALHVALSALFVICSFDAALTHHLLEVAIAHAVTTIPPDRPEHDLTLEVTSPEVGHALALSSPRRLPRRFATEPFKQRAVP